MFISSTWKVTNEYQNTSAEQAFSSLDKVFALVGEKITDDKLSNVHRVEIDGTGYYVKRYTQAGKGLRRFMGRSRIRAEWENMLFFHKIGVPAAKVVAYGEEKNIGAMTRGALITEEVKNTKDLKIMVSARSPHIRDRKWMEEVIKQVALITRALHSHRFIHTDLKWRNILVTQCDNPKVFLIDCPAGAIVFPFLFERGRIKDLACLDKVAKETLSKAQRLKFFLIYQQKSLCEKNDKTIIKKINTFFLNRDSTSTTQ